jgi:hypothetical protein
VVTGLSAKTYCDRISSKTDNKVIAERIITMMIKIFDRIIAYLIKLGKSPKIYGATKTIIKAGINKYFFENLFSTRTSSQVTLSLKKMFTKLTITIFVRYQATRQIINNPKISVKSFKYK